MFAFLGVIIPVIIGVDYFSTPQTKIERVKNKYYQVTDQMSHGEYHIITDSYHFHYDLIFYENITIKDHLTFYLTPIFKIVSKISHRTDRQEYICKPQNIYGWPLIVVCLTFIFSIILIIKLWGWKKNHNRIKYDSLVNLGVINVFLCLFVILYVFLDHVID